VFCFFIYVGFWGFFLFGGGGQHQCRHLPCWLVNDMIKLHVVVVSFFCGSMNMVQAVEYEVHYIFSTSLDLLEQAFS